MGNASGLRDYRWDTDETSLRSLGSIERNVDKLIAHRMKKRGMIWTLCAEDRTACLINLREHKGLPSPIPGDS